MDSNNVEINEENLRFILNFGIKRFRAPAAEVKVERVDYAEIDEINHLLSKERDRQREEDFYAELSAKDFFVGPND